ncbi:MAG: anthranilate synthase component I family protein [Gammaproteobacteria bacterium]|nr:anthranilate synthase component I family protein [Gammaproteobacteria bacterium]
MLQSDALTAFLNAAETEKRVAVYQEMSADRLTLVGIAENLAEELQDGAVLESGLQHANEGRYSFILFDAMATITAQKQVVTVCTRDKTVTEATHPFTVVRRLLAEFSCAPQKQHVDFMHGAVGFITYDAIRLFETIPDQHTPSHLPEMMFKFYQTTVMLDHLQQTITLSTMVEVQGDAAQAYRQAQLYLSRLQAKIKRTNQEKKSVRAFVSHENTLEDVDVDDSDFMDKVMSAKDAIVKGDAFQIVLSRCFKRRYTVDPFEVYRALRRVSPAPYMFYFPTDYGVIIGASPEKFVSLQEGKVEMHPIAGTRQRTPQTDDAQKAQELLNDGKECAEHMMLVDLARNDLGRVCEPGTVVVDKLLQVKHFSHVSHLASVVRGQLSQDKDAFDVLAAAFPAGTVSGAPKIRAMQLIDDLETSKRGLYGGALCRLDYQGNLDSCLAIRTAMLQDGTAVVRAGAGVVFDSNPAAEAAETRQKACGILAALALAEEGLS